MKLKRIIHGLMVAGLSIVTSACLSTPNTQDKPLEITPSESINQTGAANSNLVVTSWNVEHLAYPSSDGCKPRNEQELKKLREYVRSLGSDIVALQEVASIRAVEQIFSKDMWQIYISDRTDSETYLCRESGRTSTQQKVAFAVKKGLSVNRLNTFSELGLNINGLRHGLELEVETPFGTTTLLNVHMKSGCFVDDYSRADTEACKLLAKQAPILDRWIEKKEKQNSPYVVLGDFNHRLSAPYNRLTRELTSNRDKTASSLINSTAGLIGCHPYYPAPIDHIWIGKFDTNVNKAASVMPFEDMLPKAMLSDHCAVSLQLSLPEISFTNSVKWHTKSKEYPYLTRSIYGKATSVINSKILPQDSWAVVMDIDETVLDNSAYQVLTEKAGLGYHPESWAQWVGAEKATLVPGVKDFIETVLKRGGKLALITNRNRDLDHHTWRNLQALGLPISVENTCLLGRTAADKNGIDHKKIKNDKDLRRQQIQSGTAECYLRKNQRHSGFSKQQILMQVGDNIEDFEGVTQEDANIEALLTDSVGQFILLPNAMYGSW